MTIERLRAEVERLLEDAAAGSALEVVHRRPDRIVLFGSVNNAVTVHLHHDPVGASFLVTVGGLTSSGGRHTPEGALLLLGSLVAAVAAASNI